MSPVRTARLRLRAVTADDAEAMFAYRSRPDVARYVPFEPMTLAAIEERIAGQWTHPPADDDGRYSPLRGIALADSDRVIGDLSVFLGPPEHRGAERGGVISPDHGGRGYATEAVHALMHIAFDRLGLRRVTARIDVRNDASARLAERLGMRREAHLVENEWFKGGFSSEYDYALLDREWATEHAAGPGSCRWPLVA